MTSSLVLCSKSTWLPSIRREHALAQEAVRAGITTTFLQQPSDVRAVRRPASVPNWVRGLAGASTATSGADPRVLTRSTLVPGHRGELAQRLDSALLRHVLSREADADSTVVAMLPWEWAAVSSARVGRRVFDCTDDWTALIPARAAMLRDAYRSVAADADAIIVVSPALKALFPGRDVHVVRNGTSETSTAGAPTPSPGERLLTYVGTLSERFDVDLVSGVLHDLPEWRLDLYGPCHYSGFADKPSEELAALLDGPLSARVRWRGVVDRSALPAVLDAADVLVLPNKPDISAGQSSMKLYDYAARGRPIVSTFRDGTGEDSPPGLRVATDRTGFVRAIEAALVDGPTLAQARVDWVRSNTWAARWPAWSKAAFGSQVLTGVHK